MPICAARTNASTALRTSTRRAPGDPLTVTRPGHIALPGHEERKHRRDGDQPHDCMVSTKSRPRAGGVIAVPVWPPSATIKDPPG